ncbi:MAG TPA: Rrf2 family transcriptional regulator [Dongiaceae bacterium]|nr:Rrf2 family transcriptional regulator [Dongiaceae bacterium]
MLRLSKRTDYGLMAIRHLAMLPRGERCCARSIALEYGIPPALMAKLLQRLARRGLVASQHGTKGGYQIGRAASSISLRDVIEAIEGPVAMLDCLDPCKGECPQDKQCTVKAPLHLVQRRIAELLARTTVHDLTGNGR